MEIMTWSKKKHLSLNSTKNTFVLIVELPAQMEDIENN